jgi:hypothetical protein
MLKKRAWSFTSFIDFSLIMSLTFVVMFIITLMLINPVKKGDIDPIAEYLINITWPDESPDDIDIWVKDPIGNIIYFREKDLGLVSLDRDDRGLWNDTVYINGEAIEVKKNTETVTIRGFIPGRWTVNIHYYKKERSSTVGGVLVTVEMIKLNSWKLIFSNKTTMEREDEEITIYSFHMNSQGEIDFFDSEFISLVKQVPALRDLGGYSRRQGVAPQP